MVWVGVGVAVIAVAIVSFMFFGGDDEKPIDQKSVADAKSSDTEKADIPSTDDAMDAHSKDGMPADTSMEDAAKDIAPDPEPKVEDEPKTEAPPATKIDFAEMGLESFGPIDGTSDEDWTEINSLVETAMSDSGARGTRAMGRLIKSHGFNGVPALISAFDGLDLSESTDDNAASFLCRQVSTLFHGVISPGYKTGGAQKDIDFNVKLLTGKGGIIHYWNERANDPEKLATTLELIEKKKADANTDDEK